MNELFSHARGIMERVFGFQDFRPGQEAILEAILGGEDTLVVMPTGGGKSLCYQLPGLVLPGVTLVVSPLIALMKDQVDSLRIRDLPAIAIHSLMGMGEQEEALRGIASGAFKIVYVAPERLRNGAFVSALKRMRVSLVAVDEAHCISMWGHDFRPDYLRIGRALEWLGQPQIVALTATATQRVREDIVSQLRLRAPQQFVTGFDRKNLFFEVSRVRSGREKLPLILRRLRDLQGAAIIYTGTRKAVESILSHLRLEGVEVLGYHAGMEEEERNRIQEDFMEGRANVIVATNAFGMGIDRSDIRMIIHHQVPGTIESYYQECGRAGRDGDPSACLLLYSPSDRRLQEFFIEMSLPERETILAVYQALLGRPEDPIWLTYHDIGKICASPVEEMAVGSSLKILEDAGVVHRLHRTENMAELFLKNKPGEILKSVHGRSPARTAFLQSLSEQYSNEELFEGIQFLPDEMIRKMGLSSKEAFRRIVAELEETGDGAYIPPFRGRGIRLLNRTNPEELPIDFEKLRLRKAYQLEKLNQMMAYGTLGQCRRNFLLGYFGEHQPSGNCDGCDLCRDQESRLSPASEQQVDPLLAAKILSGVARLKGKFGTGMAVKMLTGSREKAVERYRLKALSTYGLLSEYTQDQVEKWIQELLGLGLVKQDRTQLGEKNYQLLMLTPAGREVMMRKERIGLSSPPRSMEEKKAPVPLGGVFDKGLFEELRILRSELARTQGLPPYCIFQDRTLKEMAVRLPDRPEKMMAIVGVGEITFRKYGRAFLDVIALYRGRQTINHEQ
jgi:ATP-dependent DNA helicase RecQ